MRKLGGLLALVLVLGAGGALWAAAGDDPSSLLEQARGRLQAGQRQEAWKLMDQAQLALWNQLGLTVAGALLTQEEAQGFGMYNPRESNLYASGEPILAYLEPRGYRVSSPQPGLFAFGVRVDVALLTAKGAVLWGKENVLEKDIVSRRFNREFYITMTLNFSGAPAGDYVVVFTIHDKQAPNPAQVRLPLRFS